MLPYTAYDIIRSVNHEIELARKPVYEFQHTFGDEPENPSDRTGRPGGGRGLFSAALALLGRRARPTQVAPQPLS